MHALHFLFSFKTGNGGGHICFFTPILRVDPTVGFVHPQTVLQISIYLFSRAI